MRAFLFVALFFGLFATPAFAQPRAVCAQDLAVWAQVDAPEAMPAGAVDVPLPDGAATYAWACRVGRHTLTVRSAREPNAPLGECGACDLSVVSVWIDRRRVLSRLRAGDLVRQADRVLRSVTLSARSVTVCTEQFSADFEIIEGCEEMSVEEVRRAPIDRRFVRVEAREPFRWVLMEQSDRQCAALTPQLAVPHQIRHAAENIDPSLEALRFEIDWAAAGSDNAEHYATFDIDNDGLEDSVLIELDAINRDELRTEQWFWSRGETGHRVPVLDRAHEGSTGLNAEPDNYVAYRFTPIRWRGKVLLYARSLPNSGVMEEQMSAHFTRSEVPGARQPLSRGLIELTPDGGARLVCGWTANDRAEDRL